MYIYGGVPFYSVHARYATPSMKQGMPTIRDMGYADYPRYGVCRLSEI